ncbi:MAG: bifunctional folylpolyglutamate synthase/dihydrofolate synthase, partial [Bacteroidetes bacterium]|nr:bifunctional folylpolyglutamate synthase/dihydrofolate synthase [Bacteroidota bacterium]
IETGLGGRLDSTNIIAPELSIITNIGWDHMQLLGNTLPEIAFEKAGIIKKDTPVVIGEAIPETRTVFEAKAKQENAAIYFSEEYFKTVCFQHTDTFLEARIKDCSTGIEKTFEMDLQGSYQLQNLQTVLTAASLLEKKGWKITDASIHDALKNTRNLNGLHGRWEKLRSRPDIIIDVAHNEDGMRSILKQLQQMHYAQLHIVIGMVKDKDIDRVLHLMPPHAHYYFTRAQIPRALPEEALRIQAMEKRLEGNAFPDVNSALEDALTKAKEDDLILVCGSVFIAGEVKRELFGK